LSPLDRIGPEELGVRELGAILAEGNDELILATNPPSRVKRRRISWARLQAPSACARAASRMGAHGGELEYVDGGTLAHALSGRRSFG